jgi:hypothetical protein
MPEYALSGKHARLKEASGEGDSGCKFSVENVSNGPPAPGSPIQLPIFVYACRNTTMPSFAQSLLNAPGASQYFDNRLLVRRT